MRLEAAGGAEAAKRCFGKALWPSKVLLLGWAADTSWPQQANCTADVQNFMKKLAWAETAMPTEGILAAFEICFVTKRLAWVQKVKGESPPKSR